MQLFSFENAKDVYNLLEVRGKDSAVCFNSFFFYFQFSKMYAFGVSLLLFTYVVFTLICLFNILQFVPMVDTTAGADFCDKNTVFVYINFLRFAILFFFTCLFSFNLFVKT